MSAESPASPAAEKRLLRTTAAARRAALAPAARGEKSQLVAERLEGLAPFREAALVALYAPLGSELDALEIARRVLARGGAVAFPRAVPGERRLAFARCAPGDLVRGPFGAGEPPPALPELAPGELGCVIVPGLAFSEDGHRLGRGGGHYDATLALLPRAWRVGVAFEAQVFPALPREPHDAPLDALVTEARTLRFARESR